MPAFTPATNTPLAALARGEDYYRLRESLDVGVINPVNQLLDTRFILGGPRVSALMVGPDSDMDIFQISYQDIGKAGQAFPPDTLLVGVHGPWNFNIGGAVEVDTGGVPESRIFSSIPLVRPLGQNLIGTVGDPNGAPTLVRDVGLDLLAYFGPPCNFAPTIRNPKVSRFAFPGIDATETWTINYAFAFGRKRLNAIITKAAAAEALTWTVNGIVLEPTGFTRVRVPLATGVIVAGGGVANIVINDIAFEAIEIQGTNPGPGAVGAVFSQIELNDY